MRKKYWLMAGGLALMAPLILGISSAVAILFWRFITEWPSSERLLPVVFFVSLGLFVLGAFVVAISND